ncbi:MULTISPECIES: VOC family protein [Streptomyces]|uniref:Bleomycin resistance protein n=2 Tax=Streptomyces TaxID=1883 RepID=A0A101Q9B8_STRCK|nr:VOC family protein [Streptomyces corchorusii]AEY88794.1 Glyoxalase/bleomycin resistance protein/dioxygenase [Streptomyces hygroscopicus subsp. jinggangensis 5008]AGF62952.1 Glyoxalase/bleomycin resistance protein/dioxygenase [Streptomyces hygroscopicus subsp. jinggangensis TL01]KUN25645.1 bleomycin resistance protein [Streptomyces corchorusii]
MIKVAMTGVYVDDVAAAHAFYTDVLGFETRTHMDLGDGTLFVTVGAREGAQPDLQLLLEPGQGPIAEPYRRALYEAGLPCIVFSVDDLRAEYDRLRGLGVRFTHPPQEQGPVIAAVLDDTVGNLVQLVQPKE